MRRAATVLPRLFVTATDTGVGKTEVSCALLTLMRERGLRPAAFKPYESGVMARGRPADAVRLWDASGRIDPLEHVVLHTFREPLAPGVAAVREKRSISFAQTMSGFHRFDGRALVAEGAGGLLVPIDSKRDVIDLIEVTKLPVILVARAGLGTLNHTLLSLRLLDERAIPVRAVVLMKSTPARDPSEKDNAEWIRRRSGAFVIGPIPYLKNVRALSARLQRELAQVVESSVRDVKR